MLQQLEKGAWEMKKIALDIRLDLLKMIADKGKGHTGAALSMVEIVTALYFGVLRADPEEPRHPDRDRFILSKAHGCTALYAGLAERGYFPREKLSEYYECDSCFAGHPVKGLPGIEIPTGSLGHGLSIAAGMALAAKMDGKKHRIFTLLGDGELQEGSVWEAAMAAAHYGLDNLAAIVDRNNLNLDGPTEKVMALEPLKDKWQSFGWEVRISDGHDAAEMARILRTVPFSAGRPSILIAMTVKGKGVNFMENVREWHNLAPNPEQAQEAFRQLRAQMELLERGKRS